MDTSIISRFEFASVAADACVNHRNVMNNAIVVYNYDRNEFTWQSSLTPLYDSEVMVLDDAREDLFTLAVYPDEVGMLADLTDYFENNADDLWADMLARIVENQPEPIAD